MALNVNQITARWKSASTPAERDAVKAQLAPWLYQQDEVFEGNEPLGGSLRRNPVVAWEMVFRGFGLSTTYFFPVMRIIANSGLEDWMKTQLLPPESTKSSIGMNLLVDTFVASSSPSDDDDAALHDLCADFISRTLSLVARGDSGTKAVEMVHIDPARIYPFLELDAPPTQEEVDAAWERHFSNVEQKVYDPSGLRLQKAVAFALLKCGSGVTDSNVGAITRLIRVSPAELLCYVGNAHHYLDSCHTNGDLQHAPHREEEFDVNCDILQRSIEALGEALGPRVNQPPENYPAFDCQNQNHLVGAILGEEGGDIDRVLTLLSQPHGLDPDDCRHDDEYGCTALNWASRRGYVRIVDLLLAAGADPNKQAISMGNPLHWASSYAQGRSCLRLLRAGARLDAEDDGGALPADCVGRFQDGLGEGEYGPNGFLTHTVVGTVSLARNRGNRNKQRGNDAFRRKNYQEALSKYQEALEDYAFELPFEKSVVHSNRAQCYLNMSDFVSAKREALQALKCDGSNEKARFRLQKAEDGLAAPNA